MLLLEPLSALLFWSHFVALLALSEPMPPVLPPARVAERAWTESPDGVWTDPLEAAAWSARWRAQTGCCVEFRNDPQGGACSGRIRIVHAKTLPIPHAGALGGVGFETRYVAVSCL